MNATSLHPAILDPLHRLNQRVRWKRWLGKLCRCVWLVALAFLLFFAVDCVLGLNTLSLRIVSAATLILAIGIGAAAWIASWHVRLDMIGLAQLFEKQHPELAERLVTLVQLQADDANPEFARLLQDETEQQLATVDPEAAYPLHAERNAWLVATVVLATLFVGLFFLPAFRVFSYRFLDAWATPLIPFAIEMPADDRYALVGGTVAIEAKIQMQDRYATAPTTCKLVCVEPSGRMTFVPMKPTPAGFSVVLENLRKPLRFWTQAGDIESVQSTLHLVDSPTYAGVPTMIVTPPNYLHAAAKVIPLDSAGDERIDILQFSRMQYQLPLDRVPINALLHVKRLAASENETASKFVVPVDWKQRTAVGNADLIANETGTYEAELMLELEHGLTMSLPLGRWTVHADHVPRFTQPLRLHGIGTALQVNNEYRIAPDDALRLQTAVEDIEGLDGVAIEYRINDEAPRIEKWLSAKGRTQTINEWLPLPSKLKEGDRVRFRVLVSDIRRLRKGELTENVPAVDLGPQVVIAPAGGQDAWIELRVDRSVGSFVKQQAQAQAEEIRDVIGKIRAKLQAESDQMQQLQRVIHQQSALTANQMREADKLRALNREITEDLFQAGQRFSSNPELAKLAEHFFDIADSEMQKSGDAIDRFREKDRSLADAEKELPIAQDALQHARKKLDRMLDWNTLVAQDRFDQWQLDKLAKRQKDLADRLEKMLAGQPPSDDELAKQIEAVRQEQAKLAEQTEQLKSESQLVQESLQALQQMRAQQIALEAQQLAADQKAMRELPADKMPAELAARLAKLAERQADLADRVQPFAKKNAGPEVKPAHDAAAALKKPQIGDALYHQQEHEKRLQEWLAKLLPGNALRDQILQLAKKQKDIRADLEQLGQDLPKLDEKKVQDRLRELVTRQKDLHAAITKLPIDRKDERLQAAWQNAQDSAKQAGDQLAGKDALSSHQSMERTHQELQALAALLAKSLPVEPKQIKDVATRGKIEQIDKFEKEQKQLREETEGVLADWMKALAKGGGSPLKEKADKLAADLMELIQKGGPEAKAMAGESAPALEAAKKAMEASQAMKAKGAIEESKKMDDEAAKQLDIVVKQLAKLTQDQMPKKDAEKTAQALEDGAKQMRIAEDKLPKMPKDAQTAMQSAAQKLAQAAQQAGKPAASKIPQPPGRSPAAKAMLGKGNAGQRTSAKLPNLDPLDGKAWGELPGELKTQMLQDFRARFGEEYAELIRAYFERLAETPARKE